MADLNARKLQQAAEFLRIGDAARARALVEPIARAAPGSLPAQRILAGALLRLGDLRAAAERFGLCCRLKPDDLELKSVYGECLGATGKYAEAIEVLTDVCNKAPANTRAAVSLASAWTLQGRPSKAAAIARRAFQASPDNGDVMACLAQACVAMGRADEGYALYSRAIAQQPKNYKFCEAAAIAAMYAGELPPEQVLAAHRRYAESVEPWLANVKRPVHQFKTLDAKEADGPLRIGILSPDLRRHAVAFYLLPLFEALDRDQFQLYMYSTGPKLDDFSDRFRALARAFRDVHTVTGHELARIIAADRVNILIETAGLTTNNRLASLAVKPAPVQASYLGYPGTTGFKEVDARLVDSQTDPNEAAALSVEKLVRIDPCCMVFRPLEGAPNVAPVPSASGAPFTFGSFSTISKFNEPMIRAWTRIVQSVPGSRLVLRHTTLADEGVRADLASRFGAAGLPADRINIEPPDTTGGVLLDQYAHVDVALDTFPYSGTTTVCEALFMGVPVVIRPGRSSASRQSLSILKAVGLDELIARDDQHFISIAAALADDPARLAHLRSHLRDRFNASPVCDAPGLARRFERALRDLWRAHAG